MEKHFVTFLSPGTFVHEETTQPIDSWDVREAFQRATAIVERYDARPFAFQFSTRSRGDEDLDSKVTEQSGRYFLGGRVRTYEQVCEEANLNESILRSNMRINEWRRVITLDTPWRSTHLFEAGDVQLDADGNEKERG